MDDSIAQSPCISYTRISHHCFDVQVQALIGASNAAAFDLTAACSGFVLALVTGTQYIRTGTFKNILIIGGDALSRFTDWRDRCRFLQRLHGAHVVQ